MRRKTRAPSLFAKTAFDPTFIDSLAIDERGGGEGKLESEIQLSKTIFFFFLALCSSLFFCYAIIIIRFSLEVRR